MDRVFLVLGSSGEYSDWREWPVRAFPAKAQADAFVARCDEAARRRPAKPPYPPGARVVPGGAAHMAYMAAYAAWRDEAERFVASCPDDAMPHEDPVDYAVAEVPFGEGSTALPTAPPRLRHRERRLSLDEDENNP